MATGHPLGLELRQLGLLLGQILRVENLLPAQPPQGGRIAAKEVGGGLVHLQKAPIRCQHAHPEGGVLQSLGKHLARLVQMLIAALPLAGQHHCHRHRASKDQQSLSQVHAHHRALTPFRQEPQHQGQHRQPPYLRGRGEGHRHHHWQPVPGEAHQIRRRQIQQGQAQQGSHQGQQPAIPPARRQERNQLGHGHSPDRKLEGRVPEGMPTGAYPNPGADQRF